MAALRRVRANLKRYRAAVLKAACEGRLVPTEAELAQKDGRVYETGEQLLARILTGRRRKWSGHGNYREPAGPDSTSLPTLPAGWTWAGLDQLQWWLRNGIPARPDGETGLLILRISAVRPLSVNLTDTRFLNAQASDYSDYVLNEGDLLFTRYNGNPELVGVCGVVPSLATAVVHPDKLIRCKLFSDLVLPDFVAVMANVGVSRNYLAKRVRTTAGQAGISGGDLKGMPIPLAPTAEQERIAAELKRRLSLVEELEAVVAANLQRANRLRQSILQHAFTGQLAANESAKPAIAASQSKSARKSNRHFARALLSAEIVYRLHNEPTFGRVKHQKIFHLCEHIARIQEIEGQYHREAAGPLDNRLIYANVAELKRQRWYEEGQREGHGHSYQPMVKAGSHRQYIERRWPEKLAAIERLIELMRRWNTDRCEIFSTTYAAWNDLILWGREAADAAILHEILNRWHESKSRFAKDRWRNAIAWIKKEGFVPTGFGKPTCEPGAGAIVNRLD